MNDEFTPESPPSPPATEPPKPPTPPAPTPPEPKPPVVVPEPDEYFPEIEETPQRDPRLKSPVAAAVLSVVPFGLGHLYLGQYSRAFTVFAGFWLPILFLGWPMTLVGVFVYFFALFDAIRQAQLINLAVGSGVEHPASTFSGGLAAGVFLVVLGTVLLLNYHFDLYFIREFVKDWWPAFLVAVGVWFIFGAVKEKQRRHNESMDSEEF